MRELLQKNVTAAFTESSNSLFKDGIKYFALTLAGYSLTFFSTSCTYIATSSTKTAIEKMIAQYGFNQEKRFKDLVVLADKKLIGIDPRFIEALVEDYERSKKESYSNTFWDTASADTKDFINVIIASDVDIRQKTHRIRMHMEKHHGRMCYLLWHWHVVSQKLFVPGERFCYYYDKLMKTFSAITESSDEEFKNLLYGHSRIVEVLLPLEDQEAKRLLLPPTSTQGKNGTTAPTEGTSKTVENPVKTLSPN